MPRFDWKLDLGGVMTVLISLLTVGVMYGSITTRLGILDEKVAAFARVMERIQSLETQMIRLETKLDERSVREEQLGKKLERVEEKIK